MTQRNHPAAPGKGADGAELASCEDGRDHNATAETAQDLARIDALLAAPDITGWRAALLRIMRRKLDGGTLSPMQRQALDRIERGRGTP